MIPLNRAQRYVLAVLILAAVVLMPTLAPVKMAGVTEADDRATQNTQSTYFTNLSFSSARDGGAMDYFPVGTREVFARWNFVNVPAGTTLLRQWYRNGTLYIQKSEPWNMQNWGTTGYLNHISIYDYTEGLTPGYYHVVISLMANYPAAQVIGDFVIADKPSPITYPTTTAAFTDLTMSTSAAGPITTAFPAGTPLVSARWNYANIPQGSVVQRDWYLNGMLFRSVQEPWSAYWGNSGRLTHIALYDYERGLAAGNYKLVVFLKNNPAVQAQVSFTIGAFAPGPQPGGNPTFNNLSFTDPAFGTPMAIFARGTTQVSAIWTYANIPAGTMVLRRWYRNGVLYIERQEPWTLGTAGTVNNVSIYDYTYGLLPGSYYVEMSLMGYPSAFVSGYFTIN